MGEVYVDYLDTYRKFFDRFTSSVDPSDQLPVKVAGYNVLECEIPGATADWTLQYLEQRRCPPCLIAHLVRRVVEEVKALSKEDPISCGFRGEIGDYLSLKLMQVCIAKLVDVCARYRDNAELSSLPPPHPLPPVTCCAIKNSRRSMEDRHVVIHDFHALFNIKGWGPASYYGVLDGHNGIDAAIYSVSHLHQYLAESPFYPANPVKALHDACCKTDDLFTIKAQRENLHGGTTAVVALLRPKERKLYVAWLGDSQAVLVRQGRPIQIVRPHKPDRPDERDRIEGMGGTVLYWGAWRVNGQLAVSRAIGDAEYKPYVTAEPDIEEITLDGTEDFLILACDGLWDFVTEQQATSAVYKQLQENPDDLEAVSHRLVALSKEQSSQDNISVVVVFLTDPAELAKRPPMETPVPNPFNGAEMFNGQSHHRTPGHPGPFDDEDFGPETDVDMVDDVLLSPAIAAAKALVSGANEDDYERQRQQMKEFDDPGDLEKSRDTPTPPAHEVVRDASADNLAESGGEESEEEWNYIPGKDTENPATAQAESKQEEEDMNSQLNPNAAEFVPVSPTRLAMDDPIIASSPARGFEKSLDDVKLPSEVEFTSEISQRPSDLEYSNGPKHGDDFFNNLSSLHNKSKGINPLSACSELTHESIINFNENSSQENVPFDKLAAVQNIEEKVTSAVLEKANIFGMNNDFSNNAFEATNIFGKSDPMTASFIGKDLSSSPEPEDSLVPGTPRSTTVEAPSSPTGDEISPPVHQTELDSPTDDFIVDTQKSPDLISPGDGPQEGLISAQERTSSSGFESESGADEVDPNIVSNEGFITEHRRSPPIDLSAKPIETFNDTNPFGTSQTPSSTIHMDQFDTPVESYKESVLETPKNADQNGDQFDFLQSTPSFEPPQFHAQTDAVQFDQLEPHQDALYFGQPHNANNTFSALTGAQNDFQNLSPIKSEPDKTSSYTTNVNDITQELFSDDTNPEIEETSFTTEKPEVSESHIDLDTTEGFLATESKILQDENECEQTSKLDEDLKIKSEPYETEASIPSPVSPKAVEQAIAAFDEINVEMRHESTNLSRDSDTDMETKEMKLEFESHIVNSQPTPEELKNLDEGFEVINKDELAKDILQSEDSNKHVESHNDSVEIVENPPTDVIDLTSPVRETNPFKMEEDTVPTEPAPERRATPTEFQNTSNKDFFSAVDQFSSAVQEDLIPSGNFAQLSSSQEPHDQLEPEATKTVSYQTLTPANEPQISKSESYVTGEEEKVESSISDEHSVIPAFGKEEEPIVDKETPAPAEAEVSIVQKIEPVQSTVVTETLITALEETSEVPSVATTEVPSSTGTPPPTPAPGLDDSKELQDLPKTDILVAAVAAAGAVAAGTAILAEKEGKKTKEVAPKKSAVSAKKSDTTAKPAVKSTTTKAQATKPPGSKTTATATSTKASGIVAKSSTAPAKTTTTAKKPTSIAPKPAPTKTGLSGTAKQSTSSTKPVPKQLPLSKTTSSTLKPLGSKPSTPSSKPSTPTTPKSPLVKSETVKSPARPLAAKTSLPKPPTEKVTEKNSLTNGEIKPLLKKTEVPRKPSTTKPLPRPTAAPANKSATAPKLPSTTTNATKTKLVSATTAAKQSVTATKRPTTAPAGKTASGKDLVNKQVPGTKSAMNGKPALPKTAVGLKKTDPKANAKPATKPPPIRKPEELKKVGESPVQIQEADVTTTNGFAEHNGDRVSLEIEELAPTSVEIVN